MLWVTQIIENAVNRLITSRRVTGKDRAKARQPNAMSQLNPSKWIEAEPTLQKLRVEAEPPSPVTQRSPAEFIVD